VFVGNAGACMYFKSKKHECQVTSSTDAEVLPVIPATLIGDFYKQTLEYFKIECDMRYLEDNSTVILYAERGFHEYDKKRKFLINKINEFHQYFEDPVNRAEMVKVHTAQNVSDIGTKALVNKRYFNHDSKLRGDISDLVDL
jgi:hypothetical protein